MMRIAPALTTLSTLALCATQIASAAPPRDQYLRELKIAQEKVERTRAANSASALSSPVIKLFYGRYYQVGDSWDVAAFKTENPMARMVSDPHQLRTRTSKGGIFHYEVTDVKNGPVPEVTIRVTQVSEMGLSPVDKRVEELQLTMTDKTVQTQKTYKFAGRSDLVHVAPDGLRSAITEVELYPLDVPEVLTAKRKKADKLPQLPPQVQTIADQAGYGPDLAQSFWVEQDDFFGRPIELLWQQGDPWPSYLKTSNGVAILIRKRSSS